VPAAREHVGLADKHAANAQAARAVHDELHNAAQRLNAQAQRHCGEDIGEVLQRRNQDIRGEHDVDHERDLGFQATAHTGGTGAQLIHHQTHAPGIGQHGATGIGQHRKPLGAIQQLQAELRLQRGDGVADDGLRAVQAPRGGGKAAFVHDCCEHAEMVQRRQSRLGGFHVT
jgi:hypothetical protein